MHGEAKQFTMFVQRILPEYFSGKVVLDVGGGDINGNNRFLFTDCRYEVNDVIQAPNVTIVSKTKDLPFQANTFDTIVSTECFEHDPEYRESLNKIYSMLRPGGLFFFTCASTGRPEHGTRRTSPRDSYGTIGNVSDMVDYYKNLTVVDIHKVLSLDDSFSVWNSYYNAHTRDLYFVGIKKGGQTTPTTLPTYEEASVMETTQNANQPELLESIFERYKSDKRASHHNYTRQYESLLKPYRTKAIKYLEIGVAAGDSLHAMREAFPNAECIVGLDINKDCIQFADPSKSVFVEIMDAGDPQTAKKLRETYGGFDIILYDEGHKNSDVIKAFELLFPLLNDNGLYIVEDTICFKVDSYIDPNYPNHLQYFALLTPFLNQWRAYDSTGPIRDNCVDPFKIIKKTTNVFEYSIDKIEFGCSYIGIHKKLRHHWIP
jgi:ubiquinone/menaquinone biosynthesis C-methylase UbiE